MKRFFPLMAALSLAACAGSQTPAAAESADASMPAVGMANPASVYCVQQGGKSEIRKNQDGSEYGMCILPDGKEVEEWAYFRSNNGGNGK
ncbi:MULTISPECIES: DUF333 domain-containing protein [unclassified Eikenella]|uniref:putative hemolysin n=1 Tax=unclassified Eikenella TaxID=2639367 RepID=UPI0008A5D184|nr:MULTISPECIES: DUF333 domain-containing protein [unclassified Eikenella]OFK88418.1 hemolysin [Eikenella sp. HMSC071B05]OFO48171.1 hemolysin [Eikenella sp. HMSC073A11]